MRYPYSSSAVVDKMGTRRAVVMLWIGAGLGLALALTSIAVPAKGRTKVSLSPGVVAIVNGQPLARADYDVALRAIRDFQQYPVTESNRQAALDRIIDEELLIEYGLDLGLARDDPTTRQALLSAARDLAGQRYRQGAAEKALAEKLAELRKAANIRVAPALP